MFDINTELPRPLVDELIRVALLEDLGQAGDITSLATLPAAANAEASFQSRVDATVCGVAFAASAFRQIGDGLNFVPLVGDGEQVVAGQKIATVSGPARLLLSAERTALNFLTHLSGIATATAKYAAAIAHTNAKVTCTRKTLPGLRAAQKYAVRMGGGSNHRYGLSDAILVKDNHIAVCGGVAEAAIAAREGAGHLVAIEIEVDSLDQFAVLLELPEHQQPNVVMLDNMTPELLSEGVRMRDATTGRRILLEASGGITMETIASVAEAGVDYISSGWLTASAPAVDIGLDIEIR